MGYKVKLKNKEIIRLTHEVFNNACLLEEDYHKVDFDDVRVLKFWLVTMRNIQKKSHEFIEILNQLIDLKKN
jgi:hypothetical protein